MNILRAYGTLPLQPGEWVTPSNKTPSDRCPLALDDEVLALEAFGLLEIKTFDTGWYIKNISAKPLEITLIYRQTPP